MATKNIPVKKKKPVKKEQPIRERLASNTNPFISDIERAEASTVKKTEKVKAAQTGEIERAGAAQIGEFERAIAERAGVAREAQAAEIERTGVGEFGTYDASQLDTTRADQFRERQLALAAQLENVLAGREKSLAELQFEKQRDENLATMQGQIASQRGLSAGLAARAISSGGATMQQNAARDAAMMRLAEIQQARGQLADISGAARQSDLATAQFNAAALNEAGQFNVGQLNQRQALLAQIEANRASEQARLANAMSQFNVGQANQMTQFDIQNANAMAQFNASEYNRRMLEQAAMQQNVGLFNTEQYNANMLANTQLQQQSRLANQAAINNMRQFNAGQNQQVSLSNASQYNQAMQANAQFANQWRIQQDQSRAQLGAAGISANASMYGTNVNAETQRLQMLLGLGNFQSGANQRFDTAQQGAVNADREREAQATNDIISGGLGTIGAIAALSDESTKKDIKKDEGKDAQVKEFLDNLGSYLFKYKNQEKHGKGEYPGTMAQDLEKSSLGKVMIKEDEEGTKNIVLDKNGLGIMFSALANLNERLKKQEK